MMTKRAFYPRKKSSVTRELQVFNLSAMSAVGSLVFCTDCGNLLDNSTGNQKHILVCECCGAENNGTHREDLSYPLIETDNPRYCLKDYYRNYEAIVIPFPFEAKTIGRPDGRTK
jgi:hypothetical protein